MKRENAFGRFMRKLRVDNREVLKHMSARLGMSLSQLAYMENGDRNINNKWIDVIINEYSLDDKESNELRNAVLHSKAFIRVDLENMESYKKEVIFNITNNIDNLSKGDIEKINKIIRGE